MPESIYFFLCIGCVPLCLCYNKTFKSSVKYADDCTLPDNWRSKGLEITPTQYLSFLERRVKSGYTVTVSCEDSSETFTSEIRNDNTGIGDTIDESGYVKVYCDTNSFDPDIFEDSTGTEYTTFCEVGCTDVPLDATLYNISYPDGSQNGDTPVTYTASNSTWSTDAATAITVSCKEKFTRPVNDEGVNTLRCKKTGGYTPTYDEVHSCKPGCEDWSINTMPGLMLTTASKTVSTKSGDPPYTFADEDEDTMAITFTCVSSYTMYLSDEELEQSVHWCSKTDKGWNPDEKPYCVFEPSPAATCSFPYLLILFLLVTNAT